MRNLLNESVLNWCILEMFIRDRNWCTKNDGRWATAPHPVGLEFSVSMLLLFAVPTFPCFQGSHEYLSGPGTHHATHGLEHPQAGLPAHTVVRESPWLGLHSRNGLRVAGAQPQSGEVHGHVEGVRHPP